MQFSPLILLLLSSAAAAPVPSTQGDLATRDAQDIPLKFGITLELNDDGEFEKRSTSSSGTASAQGDLTAREAQDIQVVLDVILALDAGDEFKKRSTAALADLVASSQGDLATRSAQLDSGEETIAVLNSVLGLFGVDVDVNVE